MKPFLLLSIRAESEAADDEYESFLRFAGLPERDLRLVNLARGDQLEVDPEAWSGVLLGGGPWNASDPESSKSEAQRVGERALLGLLDAIVAADFPFLGACYGIGTLGIHQGGIVDRSFPEAVGPLSVTLTEEGMADPVFANVPTQFAAYGGHKEAMTRLPASATPLATSADCPVQAFRVGANVYATQFHPELDDHGICTRIEVYKHHGYFEPAEAEALKARSRAVRVIHPMTILGNFVERHRR